MAVLAATLVVGWGAFWNSAAWSQSPDPEPPVVAGLVEVTDPTDTTAKIEFRVAPGDGENLEVELFHGKQDGGTLDDAWSDRTGPLKPDPEGEPGTYAVELSGLEPETVYLYRIKTASTAGTTWTEPAEIETAAVPTPWYVTLAYFAVFMASLIVPFVVGDWLAKSWRMPDYGWKLGIILFSLVWGVYFVSTKPLSLGIDLSGGVVLVYELDETKDKDEAEEGGAEDPDKPDWQREEEVKDKMNKLVSAIQLRVDPGGTRNVDIRPYGLNQIEVTIPRANPEEVNRIRKRISEAGTLEFRILANPRDHKALIAQALQSRDAFGSNLDDDTAEAWWVPIRPGHEQGFVDDPEIAVRKEVYRGRPVVEVLIVNDSYNVKGGYLSHCSTGIDNEGGGYAVRFNFNRAGAILFGGLTHDNQPDTTQNFFRKLGIILNGRLYSAPVIKVPITGGSGEITGRFTEKEAVDLVNVLNAGSLPAKLKANPISELRSGPALGKDTIERAFFAIGMSLVVVLVFMLVYYRFAGLVACGALLMNLLLLMAIMMALKVDFTLPGIAGLVLTVGMAVDANVLIYERIREELARDAGLRMAIRNGFGRALSAIVDANLTTLITAVLLYAIGTPQIRGFAVVLILGVLLSMFTAIFCSRVVFDVAERRKWITSLSMRQVIGETAVDFIGLRKIAAAGSVMLIVIGMASVVFRGNDLLDIDFTGGESVQLLFNEPQEIGTIRKTLEDVKDAEGNPFFPDVAVFDTRFQDEPEGLRFVVNTSKVVDEETEGKSAIAIVEEKLHEVFGDGLGTNRMTIDAMTPIGRTPTSDATPESSEKETPEPKEAEPAANLESRADLPPSTWLASADPAAVLLAQADPAAGVEEKETSKEIPEEAASKEPAVEVPAAKPVERPADVPAAPSPSADRFDGGTEIEVIFDHELDEETVEQLFKKRLSVIRPGIGLEIQSPDPRYESGDDTAYRNWTIRVALPESEVKEKVLEKIEAELAATPFFPASSSVGGKVAGDMQQKAVYALLGSLICIVGYLWVRFQKVMYGLAAVVALVHDVLITVG
ncbi:MAG TPA: protein translocase subunit SecD, partial [Planctomycetaceae bacterium]|nr:protein translocase subunit SecD [Planctomycetaceae bacterium]